jgi:hypothetical protein
MAIKRHKPEEIVAKLRQVEVLVGQLLALSICPLPRESGDSREPAVAVEWKITGTPSG